MDARADEIVAFWSDAGPDRWFAKDDAFDRAFNDRFFDLHFTAARGELDAWIDEPASALALMVLLDQFPRNCFRGTAHMFATDPAALHLARLALKAGHDKHVEPALSVFFYLPLMHSEKLADQDEAVRLCAGLDDITRKSAAEHRDIIARFGRFPHRNTVLRRETTPDEQRFLSGGGFSG